MARKLANKNTKELLDESEIRERGLPKGEFRSTWQGRICILKKEESMIAGKMNIDKTGEYAIKVR